MKKMKKRLYHGLEIIIIMIDSDDRSYTEKWYLMIELG
jgi:hypothetical protein